MSRLDENQVLDRLSVWFRQEGYEVIQAPKAGRPGIDLIVVRDGLTWHIEAKGNTSSTKNSKRAGIGFKKEQIEDRIEEGFFQAVTLAERPDRKGALIALAMPRDPHAERHLGKIANAMRTLNIKMIWLESDGDVTIS